MNFNFRQGTELAIEQDRLIALYKTGEKISKKELDSLKNNLWVASALTLAPNNLVIRQYCLIDLFTGTPTHCFKIYSLLTSLCFDNGLKNLVFMEGYSYFRYTMMILGLWMEKFQDLMIKFVVEKIEKGFINTSYKRGDLWYPAPVGDLRDEPLAGYLQVDHSISTIHTSRLSMIINNNIPTYYIKGSPKGFNTHLPLNDSSVMIIDGIPKDFKFYEGYDKKYKNKFEEFKDTFNIKRIKSI